MKNAPSRDTIILWSAVIAGIGLLALLVRHAAIYKFGTDTFTGNVLFGVIFILLVGLYLGFQSLIEDLPRTISNFFRRKDAVVIAETTFGDIIIVSYFITGSGHAQDENEFRALCNFIFERCSRHGLALLRSPYFVVKHLAVETPIVTFTKEVAVPGTLIPCMKFA